MTQISTAALTYSSLSENPVKLPIYGLNPFFRNAIQKN